MKLFELFGKTKEDELPEELRGLDAAGLANAVKEREKFKADLAAAQAQIATLEPVAAEVEDVKARLAELEGRTAPPTKPDGPKKPTSVLVNEDQAFGERLTPIVDATLLIGAQSARAQAVFALNQKYQIGGVGAFTKYAEEIDKVIATVPPARRIDPQTWENALKYVMGTHMTEIMAEQQKSGGTFFVESGAGSGSPGNQPSPDKKDTLTDTEKKVAARMGVTEADYLKQRQGMQVVQ